MRNAFMCPSYDSQLEALRELVQPEDLQLASQVFYEASVDIPAQDGVLQLTPSQGGLMGNPVIVKVFSHTFKWPVSHWLMSEMRWAPEDHNSLWIYSPITNEKLNASVTVYADDIAKMHTMINEENATPLALAERLHAANSHLDDYLDKYLLAQNKDKQEVGIIFFGKRRLDYMQTCYSNRVISLEGKVTRDARLLGERMNINQGMASEIALKVNAAKRGYATMGKLWRQYGKFPTFIKLIYKCITQGSLLSGLIAIVLSDGDSKRLTSTLEWLGRMVLAGKACHKIKKDTEDEIIFRSYTNAKVYDKVTPRSTPRSTTRLHTEVRDHLLRTFYDKVKRQLVELMLLSRYLRDAA